NAASAPPATMERAAPKRVARIEPSRAPNAFGVLTGGFVGETEFMHPTGSDVAESGTGGRAYGRRRVEVGTRDPIGGPAQPLRGGLEIKSIGSRRRVGWLSGEK